LGSKDLSPYSVNFASTFICHNTDWYQVVASAGDRTRSKLIAVILICKGNRHSTGRTEIHSIIYFRFSRLRYNISIARVERDGTRAETTFRLSPKQTSPFKSKGASVQSTAGSRDVRISLSNAG